MKKIKIKKPVKKTTPTSPKTYPKKRTGYC